MKILSSKITKPPDRLAELEKKVAEFTSIPPSKWHIGTSQPDNSFGVDGDLYADQLSFDIYYKESGAWIILGNIRGKDGLDGDSVTGQSAYQIWLNKGGQGTEDDFLLSLIGQQGNPGVNGQRGPRGFKGEKGEKGDKGEKGQDGKNGREIELRKSDRFIQWRYVDDLKWKNLIAIEELRGPAGWSGVSSTATGGSGIVESIVAGNNITVDATDPANPIIAAVASAHITEDASGITIIRMKSATKVWDVTATDAGDWLWTEVIVGGNAGSPMGLLLSLTYSS